jgi:hypothetical protein
MLQCSPQPPTTAAAAAVLAAVSAAVPAVAVAVAEKQSVTAEDGHSQIGCYSIGAARFSARQLQCSSAGA